jgi:tRNA-splicing ligase RtcB
MHTIHNHGGKPIRAWVGDKLMPEGEISPGATRWFGPDIEETAMNQLINVSKLPFIHPKGIAVMPDVHAGIGATVGSVIPTYKAIIPAAVGVDIGCGMIALRLSLRAGDLPDSLGEIRHSIERGVPLGMAQHNRPEKQAENLDHMVEAALLNPGGGFGIIKEVIGERWRDKAVSQLGSLGGGNHFIEICLDQDQDVWVMLHSGSRGIGNMIGRAFIERAQEFADKWFINLPDEDLAYLAEGTKDFDDYMAAVGWAQNYAFLNRQMMMNEVLRNLRRHIKKPFEVTQEAINCHHNYVAQENHFGRNVYVTRKGAIRAREGDFGIIPGSMGAKSYIVRGKGNPESYCSCSHGAGRKMTRTAAEKMFSVADVVEQTKGIECAKDDSVLDEIPAAYKDIDQVMANQADLVEVVHTLKQVMCVKGPKEGKKWGKKKGHQ